MPETEQKKWLRVFRGEKKGGDNYLLSSDLMETSIFHFVRKTEWHSSNRWWPEGPDLTNPRIKWEEGFPKDQEMI